MAVHRRHTAVHLLGGIPICRSAAVLLALWLVASATGARASAAEISEQQALDAAAGAASALGIPFGDGATSTFKGGGFMPPEWEVRFHSFSSIRIAAETGSVIGFVDHSALRESYSSARQTPLGESEAVAIAEGTLSAMGRPQGLVFRDATLKAPVDDIPAWICEWDQIWQGIPYYRGGPEGASVWVTGATGKVVSASIYPPLPAPESATVKVTQPEAIAIASDLARTPPPVFRNPQTTADLKIVQPNYQWSESGMADVRYDDPTRIAWVVTLKDTDEEGRTARAAEFWVDAADGSVVGGAMSGGGAPVPSPGTTSAFALQLLPVPTVCAIAAVLVAVGATALLRARRASAR